MNTILVLVVPIIVTSLTGWIKTLPAFAALSDASRTPSVRFIAAFLAFVAVILSEWVTNSFDANILNVVLQTLVLSAATWFASLGIFHGLFQSKASTASPV